MKNYYPYGPTYEEMLRPETLSEELRRQAREARKDELDPMNLFNISWRKDDGRVNRVVLPKAMTGVDANIVVLLGNHFPSGSHKVGPAYSTLIEGVVDGTLKPGYHDILGPSTGNFGIGVAYITNLMGFDSTIIMPDNMSKERYDRIQGYGAKLDLTPGTESDVILTLEKTHELAKQEKNYSLAQFELMPNYRFHRYVTGNSALEATKDVGNGRVACFAAAPGSAGTLAAGDQIKKAFPESKTVALEPYECSTLMDGGRGQHRIEGVGDKMCTLIHNVLTTDFIALIPDDDAVRGLKIIHDGTDVLVEHGVPREAAEALREAFGVSGVANILGAIKMAKHLKLGPEENVVTVATDGFDRYESVLEDLERRYLETGATVQRRWFRDIFMRAGTDYIEDTRDEQSKQRLFKQKEDDWLKFGYEQEYLDTMKSQEFWEREYERVFEYNEKIQQYREQIESKRRND